MRLIPGPRQVLREAGLLAGLPRGLAGLAWMWATPTVPVTHVQERGDASDAPPPRTAVAPDEQPAEAGHGPLLHRTFRVHVRGAAVSARGLVDRLAADMNATMVPGVARFDRGPWASRAMLVGDELVVRMPGPWDGPVRCVRRDDTSFRLATLTGHLEAGQIEFAARPRPGGRAGDLDFSVTTWARAGDRLADVFYNDLGVAKEVQFQLWVHCCVRAAALAGGEPADGVAVRTRVVPWSVVTGAARHDPVGVTNEATVTRGAS